MPRFSNTQELQLWWDENSTWAERTAFLLVNLELLYAHGRNDDAKALADMKFSELPTTLQQDMLEY